MEKQGNWYVADTASCPDASLGVSGDFYADRKRRLFWKKGPCGWGEATDYCPDRAMRRGAESMLKLRQESEMILARAKMGDLIMTLAVGLLLMIGLYFLTST